jgi:hypothetical protein
MEKSLVRQRDEKENEIKEKRKKRRSRGPC